MKTSLKKSSLLLVLLLLPLYGFSAGLYLEGLGSVIDILSVCNAVLLITSVLCIVRFFWPGDESHFLLHVFNAIFALVFYSTSLIFLINHKNYFEGYETLNNAECVRKYFLSFDFLSIIKKLIIVAFILNIIYILRHYKTYYLEG